MKLLNALLILGAAASAVVQGCHTEGPTVPRPRKLKQSATFQHALTGLSKLFDDALAGTIRAGFDIHNISFSIGITSLDRPREDPLVWEYHHLSPANVNGTKAADRHSQYLIGSISKVITDTLLFRSGIDYDDPITKYLPSLASKESLIDWGDITLRALAGQVAGVVANYGFSEFYYLKDYFEYLGFPALTNSSYPECGVTAMDTGACNKEQLLRGMLISDPVAPPYTRPVYSNIAFTLLAYAVEEYTGKSYAQLVRELGAALNMPSTRPSPGNDSLAVVPAVPNNWGADYADGVAGGGLVSTVADLSSFMHAVLTRSEELRASPTKIRAWLRPHTFTGSNGFQGSPWEIFRPNPAVLFPGTYNATSHTGGHSVTITGKDGVAYNYRSRISILDTYGVGLTILTAGDQSALPTIFDAVLSTLVPALDAVAEEQAAADYAGEYIYISNTNTNGTTSSNPNSTTTNGTTTSAGTTTTTAKAKIILDGPSLLLQNLTLNNHSIFPDGLNAIWKYSLSPFLAAEMATTTGIYRLYPAEIYRYNATVTLPDLTTNTNLSQSRSGFSQHHPLSTSTGGDTGNTNTNTKRDAIRTTTTRVVTKEDFRFEWGFPEGRSNINAQGEETETDLPGRGISEGECKSWKLVDWLYYGGRSVDRLVFLRDEGSGEVVGMEVPFLRTGVFVKVRT